MKQSHIAHKDLSPSLSFQSRKPAEAIGCQAILPASVPRAQVPTKYRDDDSKAATRLVWVLDGEIGSFFHSGCTPSYTTVPRAIFPKI